MGDVKNYVEEFPYCQVNVYIIVCEENMYHLSFQSLRWDRQIPAVKDSINSHSSCLVEWEWKMDKLVRTTKAVWG